MPQLPDQVTEHWHALRPRDAKRSKTGTEHREIEHQPSRQLIRTQNPAGETTIYHSTERSSSNAPTGRQDADLLLRR